MNKNIFFTPYLVIYYSEPLPISHLSGISYTSIFIIALKNTISC